MNKNYILKMFFIVFLFAFKYGNAQHNLADNQYGSLIKNWLDQNRQKYNLTDNDVEDLYVSDAYYTEKSRLNHLYLTQRYQGVSIYNAISSVAIKNNYVFNFANAFKSDISTKINVTTPVITAKSAIESTVSHLNILGLQTLEIVSQNDNEYVFSNGGVSKSNIPVSLVYQIVEEESLRLAWNLSIQALDGKNWYSVRVDAVSGDLLDVSDWILTCNFGGSNHDTHNHISSKKEVSNASFQLFKSNNSLLVDGSQYNVFKLPTESPNHGAPQLVSEPSNLNASPFGWHDVDGVSGADFTITRGNNVWSQEDVDGNNDMGFSFDGGTNLDFNVSFNGDQDPIGFQNNAIINLFYLNNVMHDIWFQYGFDEASGNFQETNYSGAGQGSDFVFADAQDGSGINNATFGTPPEGINPGMTMFLWSAPALPLGQPLLINNTALMGSYSASIAGFGAPLSPTPLTADLALVTDSSGGSADVNDACDTIINGLSLLGKIAVINRGSCEFGFKVLAAENEGAIAVIIINNVSADPTPLGGGAVGDQVSIPSIMISLLDGTNIINALNNGEVINASLVASGPFRKDGSLDNGIIAHEYGHGISTRLSGGPSNSGCLNNAEQMGEGWSDWFGLMLTIEPSHLPETARGVGTYSVSQPIDGGGIRPFPYSVDTSINPLTYADTNNTAGISSPHGIGTVWATILWDLNWAYVDKYGYDTDLYNGTGGNNRVMQLVLDGLKLQQCGAGFVDGRDGLLMADLNLTGGEDSCMIWEVFAARGVGFNASQGTSGSRIDQSEDFTMPPPTDPSLQNCTTLSVDEFALNSQYSIFPNPSNNIINIKVKKNFGKVNMTLTDINGRIVFSNETNLSDVVQINIATLQSGIYILTIKGEGINTNDKILKN